MSTVSAPLTRHTSAVDAVLASFAAIDADPRPGIWIELIDRPTALDRARVIDARVGDGQALPLAGTTLAVKGNIDVEGLATTAGCPAYAFRPATSAPVVQALVDAGTVVIGTTNMDQFATGLVGTRSPYGICPNAHWHGLISGGSSSGSAVAVATGMVDLALGTDTAGSGRVPAAANGIIGIKPTRGRLSLTGVVPACASLDCVSLFAADLTLAELATSVAATRRPDDPDPWQRDGALRRVEGHLRVAVATTEQLGFDGDDEAARRQDVALGLLAARLAPADRAPLATITELTSSHLAELVDTGRLLYEGALVAERYASVGEFVDAHREVVDPTVGRIISTAGRLPAWQLADDLRVLAAARRRAAARFEDLDVIVLPTVPRLPTVEQVLDAPIEVNSMLGTYTNFVNLLDLTAVTVPVGPPTEPTATHPSGHPPHSLTLIGPAWSDQVLVSLATALADGPASHRVP